MNGKNTKAPKTRARGEIILPAGENDDLAVWNILFSVDLVLRRRGAKEPYSYSPAFVLTADESLPATDGTRSLPSIGGVVNITNFAAA